MKGVVRKLAREERKLSPVKCVELCSIDRGGLFVLTVSALNNFKHLVFHEVLVDEPLNSLGPRDVRIVCFA